MGARAVARQPVRTCISCRRVRPKAQMVRFVRRPGGAVVVDRDGTGQGRGAYSCPEQRCLAAALGRLPRVLKTENIDIDRIRADLAGVGVG